MLIITFCTISFVCIKIYGEKERLIVMIADYKLHVNIVIREQALDFWPYRTQYYYPNHVWSEYFIISFAENITN